VKGIKARLRNFFFPPEGSPTWVRLLPYAVLGILTIILLTGATFGWEYTNSPEFCGESCHTMPPEYTAYLISPHARIACVDCHIGKGFITTRVTRKAGDLKHVFATMFHTYEFPIRAGDLRPARETCEKCHFPEKFSDDSLREIHRFSNDKNNSPFSIFLTLKTGGGDQRQGLGRGIHWHIQNKVEYLASDPEEQEIPYIRVTNRDGSTAEYTDIEAQLDPATVNPAELKEMDCITCHNRITHLVAAPEDTVDRLIAADRISKDIPDIHRQAVEAYSNVYSTTQQGLDGIAAIEEYYTTYYPEYYALNAPKIQQAIAVLQEAYGNSVYPQQNSDWTSHPNNIGHRDSPGCFRCHDGKHLDAQLQAIRLECNLCHSIPVVAGPYDFKASIEVSRGPEPQSHLSENWISLHNQVIDQTCSNCHTTDDAGGTSNTSFCSNSACHGNVWSYAGFDAPALREVLKSQLPPQPTPAPLPAGEEATYEAVIGPLLRARCGGCHGDGGIKGLNVAAYDTLMKGSESGPVIVPNDPQGSLLVQKQSGDQPHFGQLTPDELELVIQWINSGAVEKASP
jgi:nitrate/TMAO reductase-like tetraheme cytochrome c subunit/mono/diheme cytochrome c family protein